MTKNMTALKAKITGTLFTLIIFSFSVAQAQNNPPSVEDYIDQFMEEKVGSWEEYYVIKKGNFTQFNQVLQDSIGLLRSQIEAQAENVAQAEARMNEINQEMKAMQEQLDDANYDQTHISALGIDFQKTTFLAMTGIVLLALIVLMGIGYMKYRLNQQVTSEKRRDFDNLQEEFYSYKQRVREKEIRIMRELQTERNKLEELRGKMENIKKRVQTSSN